jgi:TolB-like protein/DNA-binding SARP family transcriptional activator/cytochrome c-type biogenesis protein CcmH/NrfG
VNAATEPFASRFRLCVLGPFRLTGARGPIDLGNKKLCGLMAFLACARMPQRREKLMSVFWGSHFELQAQQNLRKALSRLRHALGEEVFADSDELVSLRPGAVACDATAFERLIREGSLASLRAATELYTDMFLSDVSILEEGWVEWMTDQRNRLEGLAVDALVRLGELEEGGGDVQRALDLAGRAIALDELREDAHRLIIRCLAAAGRRAEALKRYDQLAALLKRELDVEPDTSTRCLIEALRLPGAPSNEHRTLRADTPAGSATDASPPLAPIDTPAVSSARPAARGAEGAPEEEPAAPAAGHWWRRFVPFGVPLNIGALLIVGAVVLGVSAFSLPGLNLAMRPGPPRSAAGGLDAVPIAVLPFTHTADDAGSRLSANMITDDLINMLSRVLGLKVISRQASQNFTGRPIDVVSIGNELGVRYVVDGSVRMQNERLRVNVQLLSTESRLQVWSDHFERDITDAGAAPEEIVKGLGRALQVEVIRAENSRAAQHKPEEPEINELVSTGWAAMFADAAGNSLPQAEAAFREALRRDPERLRAILGLAAHHLAMVGNMHTPDREPYLAAAQELLDRALKRNPAASPPYFYLGILRRQRGEMQPALHSFEYSIVLNPSFAPGYAHMGSVLTRLGRMDEALEKIHYAMRLSPKDPKRAIWAMFAGWAELERGNDQAALEWLFQALALNSESAQANGSLAAAYALSGESVSAAKYAARFRELTPAFSDEQRLEGFGAGLEGPTTPHRLIDGGRKALGLP